MRVETKANWTIHYCPITWPALLIFQWEYKILLLLQYMTFFYVFQFEGYTITPVINRVSYHDAQLLTISTDYSYIPTHRSKTVRKTNKYTISYFVDKLSCESWDSIFNSEDVTAMFNSFPNIYLRICYSSFPLKKSN